MHGIVFVELEKFVKSALGPDGWGQLLSEAGLPPGRYKLSGAFPDEEVMNLVGAAVKLTGKDAPTLLEAFGDFIAPDLLGLYASLVKKGWSALDILEHTEGTIHSVVRVKNAGATPPALEVVRVSKDEVKIVYRSARKMCALAKGIAKGIGRHKQEPLKVDELACMHRGDAACEIRVRA